MAAFGNETPTRYERMLQMEEPWGSSHHHLQEPMVGGWDWYPLTFSSDTNCTTTFTYMTSASDVTVVNMEGAWATAYYPPADEWEESSDPLEALKEWHRALSRQHIKAARIALRGVPDDPGSRIPLQARRTPYIRPRAKKRVCAGSSRYRVLIN